MSATRNPRPVYLGDGEPLLGLLHHSVAAAARDVAVLMLPPFGWDDVCSYRSRREWGAHLAQGGYPTLRIDLPGSGDSAAGPRDPGRLEAWGEAAATAAAWLRERTGARRVVAVGIGLGGMIAGAALAAGAPIDDLVLWATPARGSRLLRELRAFASLEEAGFSPNRARGGALALVEGAPPADEGELEVGGFLLSGETVRALESLDLSRLPVADGAGRSVLLLERDGLPVDARLRSHYEACGLTVAVAAGEGFGAMMAEPQESVPPARLFGSVDGWLQSLSAAVPAGSGRRDAPTGAGEAAAPNQPGLEAAQIPVAGDVVSERPFTVEAPGGGLFGILALPSDVELRPLCVVFLSAGAIHRIGPNRMWVEAARRWAAKGVPSLRLDLAAIGDSDGDTIASRDPAARYAPETIEQVRAALDGLQAAGLGPPFALCGLCSGAYWSFQGALVDERVQAAMMLNPAALFWHPDLDRMRDLRAGLRDTSLWRRALRGEVSMARLQRLLRWAPRAAMTHVRHRMQAVRRRHAEGDPVLQAFELLLERDRNVLFAFSEREPLHEEMQRDGQLDGWERWPNMRLDMLPGEHHSLREIASQRAAHVALDRALERELARLSGLGGARRAAEARAGGAGTR